MKRYECGSLVPGCNWHTEAPDEAEIVRRAVDHMRAAHNEQDVRPEMINRIKDRIKPASDAA